MKERSVIPVITKPAHAKEMDDPARLLFELEGRCTDLYDLCFEHIPAPGREWTTGPVVMR